MTGVYVVHRATYFAPTKHRHYLTARAAAKAEAGAMLAKKYPTEKPAYESETGRCYDGGYHWSNDERLVKVHKRLSRLYMKKLRRLAC